MSEDISMEEACEFLQCGPVRLLQLLNGGELPGLKVGRSWVLPRVAFFDAVNRKATKAAELRRLRTTEGTAVQERLEKDRQRDEERRLSATEHIEALIRKGRPRRPRTVD